MSDESIKPGPDASKSEERKSVTVRKAQIEDAKAKLAARGGPGANLNPIVLDETYGGLREQERVVMRHQIALNIDRFRAAPDEFEARSQAAYPPLTETTAPFASIVVANFNGAQLLPTLLGALERQTFKDFEVIVVDDASLDESVKLVEASYPDVRLVVHRRNLGFVAACNAGAGIARGRMLVQLNNDTEPEPTWLEELVRAFCAYPEAAIVASKLLLFDDRRRLHSAGDLLGRDGIPRNRGVWEEDHGQYDRSTIVFSGCGGATAYRREVWQALGGYDEEFWMYVEDVDFAFRAQLLGWGAVFAPDACVYHHLSATGGGALASYYVGRNTIWMVAKNMPTALLWRGLPAIAAAQLRIAVDALRHWRGEAARARLAGQLAGLLGLHRQRAKRRQIQSRRQIDSDAIERLLIG